MTEERSRLSKIEWAHSHASEGWLIFPIFEMRTNGTCSCPSGRKCPNPGKHPRVSWKSEATSNGVRIDEWWQRWPQANIGIATGRRSNLWVLDVDTKRSVELGDGTLIPEGQFTLAHLEGEHERLPATRIAQTGGGGEHHYFTYPGTGDHGNRVGFAPGLDIRADDGYVVAPGSNHESGHDYEWAVRIAPAPPPGWLVTRANARSPAGASVLGDDDAVGEGGRNDYLIRWAGKYRSLEPGLDEKSLADLLWTKNLAKCEPPLEADEIRQIARSAMRYERLPNNEVLLPPGAVEAEPKPVEIPEGADLAWSIAEFMRLQIEPPQPLVHGLFDAGTGIMIAGPPNVGKTWLMMHLGLAVATGTPFLDHWPTEAGSVLIIDEEGHPYGDQQRFAMLINGHGIGSLTKVPLYLAIGAGIRLNTPQGIDIVRRMIARYNVKLTIIDSLIRVSGSEENNARGMADFFAITNEIKKTTGTAFAFVHHIRKPGLELPMDVGELVRGSSEIRAWLDTLLIVMPGDLATDMEINVNKQRWRKRPEHPFTARLLTREDTPWAKLGYQGDIEKEDRSSIGTQGRIMTAIQSLLREGKEPTLDRIAATVDLSTKSSRDHLKRMEAIGLIVVTTSSSSRASVYIPPPEKPSFSKVESDGQKQGDLFGTTS